jgi:hypothetical protein
MRVLAHWAIAVAVAGLVMGGTSPSIAAGDSNIAVKRLGPPDVEARREAMLQQMIARPSDLDLAFTYANLSAQVGDYEAAISTLERMLIYRRTPRACSSSSAFSITASAPTKSPAAISSRRSPTRTCRRISPSRCGSI